jgi:hypothetical protein
VDCAPNNLLNFEVQKLKIHFSSSAWFKLNLPPADTLLSQTSPFTFPHSPSSSEKGQKKIKDDLPIDE